MAVSAPPRDQRGCLLRTNLVEVHDERVDAGIAQQRLGGAAVRAVGLGEDDDGVAVDDPLHLRFGGHGGARTGGAGAKEAGAGSEGQLGDEEGSIEDSGALQERNRDGIERVVRVVDVGCLMGVLDGGRVDGRGEF